MNVNKVLQDHGIGGGDYSIGEKITFIQAGLNKPFERELNRIVKYLGTISPVTIIGNYAYYAEGVDDKVYKTDRSTLVTTIYSVPITGDPGKFILLSSGDFLMGCGNSNITRRTAAFVIVWTAASAGYGYELETDDLLYVFINAGSTIKRLALSNGSLSTSVNLYPTYANSTTQGDVGLKFIGSNLFVTTDIGYVIKLDINLNVITSSRPTSGALGKSFDHDGTYIYVPYANAVFKYRMSDLALITTYFAGTHRGIAITNYKKVIVSLEKDVMYIIGADDTTSNLSIEVVKLSTLTSLALFSSAASSHTYIDGGDGCVAWANETGGGNQHAIIESSVQTTIKS